MVIDMQLLNLVSEEAKDSPRLRMNYNFHQSLEDKCHRMLNAVEPGTVVPIHRHPMKDESFVILRGKVRVTTHNDDGSIIEDVVLSQESGNYGVDIPKNVWHMVESLTSGSCFFECKEGPFVPHEEDGILELPESRNH
jgi:cupin fold WbuC family metalloprotein